MVDWIAERSGRWLKISEDRVRYLLHSVGIILAVGTFVLTSTLLVAYDSIFLGVNNIASLQIGDIAPQDIRAPASVPPFISQVLTEQRKQEIRDNVSPIYFPPDPAVSRQQSETAQQILEFIQNIRRDAYGTPQQKIDDLKKITDLKLDDSIILQMLTLDEATWVEVGEQVTGVLERVMRGEIRDTNLQSVIAQLPIQVSVRFSEDEAAVIVAVVQGLIRPNTILNVTATEEARQSAITDIVVRRSFERGQVVLRAGERVDAAAYEALSVLGLLEPTNRRLQQIMRAMLVSITVLVVSGLYIARFKSDLFHSSRFIALLASIFLITLLGARIVGFYGQIYVYPTAALALLFVALIGPEIAVIGVLGLSLLIGIMQENSLEIATLVGVGGMMATLTLRRPERLNGYFMPGLLVALANVSVVMIFYQGVFSFNPETGLLELIFYCLLNGILSAALALAGMYIVTLIFNLPTGLKLVELSQPSQPLLQRLLREAPGTYQHSLQVANMAEQAATRIGVNADLVRVAALYHDVGKMMNPAFFTENQVEGVNPHDALDDPARSATIIIAHVTDGDKIARQFRLPSRIRDFIMEHHGTQVLYFYQQAVQRAGNAEAVDIEQFTYPGPKPQSRETAILMLADSCEAAVRSRKPTRKQEITDTIQQIIDSKIHTGQLDESGLTFNDIKAIRKVFVDMLQAVFHPRINYPTQLGSGAVRDTLSASNVRPELPGKTTAEQPKLSDTGRTSPVPFEAVVQETPRPATQTRELPTIKIEVEKDDESPLAEVPPLPRAGDQNKLKTGENGRPPVKKDAPEEQ